MDNLEVNEEILKKEGPHKYFGIELNKLVWSLLGKSGRSPEEDDLMIHAAHGSHFHWTQCGTNANRQRGEWLISRVYAVLNIPERSLYHARKCEDLTNNFSREMEDFDLAYANEAIARALACTGNKKDAKKYLKQAKATGNKIVDKEAKKYFDDDINSGPWFGLNIF